MLAQKSTAEDRHRHMGGLQDPSSMHTCNSPLGGAGGRPPETWPRPAPCSTAGCSVQGAGTPCCQVQGHATCRAGAAWRVGQKSAVWHAAACSCHPALQVTSANLVPLPALREQTFRCRVRNIQPKAGSTGFAAPPLAMISASNNHLQLGPVCSLLLATLCSSVLRQAWQAQQTLQRQHPQGLAAAVTCRLTGAGSASDGYFWPSAPVRPARSAPCGALSRGPLGEGPASRAS